jgi:hypothetical protein
VGFQTVLHIAQALKWQALYPFWWISGIINKLLLLLLLHAANRVDWVLPDGVPQKPRLLESESISYTRKCN